MMPVALDANAIASKFLDRWEHALREGDVRAAASCFNEDGYWRDLMAFTWNIKTLQGQLEVARMLEANLAAAGQTRWRLEGAQALADGSIEARFRFETCLCRGRGLLRLRDGKVFTLFTAAEELIGFEERKGPTRRLGAEHGVFGRKKTWSENRQAEQETLGAQEQPYCVIIGGGQGGIALGARLKQLAVPTIILEKNARAGDSWRNRYRTLVLHDPVWYDHLPYIPFPENWPVFTPKDKLADWLEMYVRVMELDYWTSSECRSAAYDDSKQEWRVEVLRDGRIVELRPKQLVFATGAYGPPNEIGLKGAETFEGEIFHSSSYQTGAPYAGKHALILGANSSAHDVAADLWDFGADVTILQRSSTLVVKSETLMQAAFAPLYSEEALAAGITVDEADFIFASTPFAVMPEAQRSLYRDIRERDASFYERLASAGFRLDFGADDSGLMMKALRTGSGYYIDVGASDLIARREIAVRGGVEIARVNPRSVELSDGSQLPADLIVCATGFLSMNRTVARIVSEQVADKVGKCWGLGSGVPGDPGPWEGELRNMWKPTQQEGLWFHGGNLHLSRYYSLILALQLKARMEKLATPVYGLQTTYHKS
jgi:putative flavoprotein involved in K+ transport